MKIIPTFYSSIKRLAEKLDEKLAIRILCFFVSITSHMWRTYGAQLD